MLSVLQPASYQAFVRLIKILYLFADDGKIFKGSGVGDPFGPRCHKGDIMGCGIMFPRDYKMDR